MFLLTCYVYIHECVCVYINNTYVFHECVFTVTLKGLLLHETSSITHSNSIYFS